MKKLLITIREYTNQQNETKKQRVNVGRIIEHSSGGESICLDAALCAVIGAMGQKALNAGEDSIWISIFEEDKNNQQQSQSSYQQPAAAPAQPAQPAYQQPAPVQQPSQQQQYKQPVQQSPNEPQF